MIKTLSTFIVIAGILALSILPVTYAKQNSATKDNSLKTFIAENDNVNAVFDYPGYTKTEPSPEKILLPAHTPIIIKASETIKIDKINSGDNIFFKTAHTTKAKTGTVLIKYDSPVEATINFQKEKRIGKAGQITISDFHVNAVDGTYIPLSSSISANGDDCMALSITLSVLVCPLFLLMRGGEPIVPAGTTKTVYTVSDVYITPAAAIDGI